MTITHGAEIAIIPVVATGALVAMAFTPADITAITVATAALLTTIFTGVATIISALRTGRKIDENTLLTQETKTQVGVVEGHVNSAATASAEQITALQKEVADTRLQMAELKQIAALLAQAKSSEDAANVVAATSSTPTPSAPVTPLAETHLKKIEKNTKDTVSTLSDSLKANTDETVDAVKDAIKKKGP